MARSLDREYEHGKHHAEYVDGELNVHDNPLGVITNAPTFDWHLTNLKGYVNLSPQDVRELAPACAGRH